MLKRTPSRAAKGLLRVDQEFKIQGSVPGQDCVGRYWIFGVCEVLNGEIAFVQKDREIHVPWKIFGMFLPPYSLVQVRMNETHSKNTGFLSSLPLPEVAPKTALIFDMQSEKVPTSPQEIFACLERIQNGLAVSRGHDCSAIAEKIKKALDSSYAEPMKLADIALQLRMGADLMSRNFKKAFGLTPVKYRNFLRVTEAMARLCDGQAIVDTSNDMGYGDLDQFYDQFNSIAWATPGDYKKTKVKKPEEQNLEQF